MVPYHTENEHVYQYAMCLRFFPYTCTSLRLWVTYSCYRTAAYSTYMHKKMYAILFTWRTCLSRLCKVIHVLVLHTAAIEHAHIRTYVQEDASKFVCPCCLLVGCLLLVHVRHIFSGFSSNWHQQNLLLVNSTPHTFNTSKVACQGCERLYLCYVQLLVNMAA